MELPKQSPAITHPKIKPLIDRLNGKGYTVDIKDHAKHFACWDVKIFDPSIRYADNNTMPVNDECVGSGIKGLQEFLDVKDKELKPLRAQVSAGTQKDTEKSNR